MAGLSTWWRKAGGVLAALVLAVMVFGPTAEAAVCADDPAIAAALLGQPGETVANADLGDEGACDDGGCPCIHCHGYHAGAYAPTSLTDAAGPSLGRERLAPADGPSPASSLIFGLKRPPRG